MKSKIWYAVMDGVNNDWGTGSFDQDEAEQMVIKHLDVYPDGYIAVIDEGDGSLNAKECVDEIYPDDFNYRFGYWDVKSLVAFVKPQDAWDNYMVEEAMRELARRAGIDPDDEAYGDWESVARGIQEELNVDLGI